MLLNLLWLAFFVSAFGVALARLAMGGMEVFPKRLAAMFDSARTGFEFPFPSSWWARLSDATVG